MDQQQRGHRLTDVDHSEVTRRCLTKLRELGESDNVDYVSEYQTLDGLTPTLNATDQPTQYYSSPYTCFYSALIVQKLQRHKIVYYQLPTGKGKSWTVILCYKRLKMMDARQNIVVVTLHRGLVEQYDKQFESVGIRDALIVDYTSVNMLPNCLYIADEYVEELLDMHVTFQG